MRKAVAFSPDGRVLASGSNDQKVLLWDAATGALHQTLKGHSDPVKSVAFSPDGRILASGSSDETVRFWDVATGALKQTSSVKGIVTLPKFSPDGLSLRTNLGCLDIQSWCGTGSPHINLEISVEQEQWIRLNGERVIWLPPEFRPSCSTIHGSILVLGHESGLISFI